MDGLTDAAHGTMEGLTGDWIRTEDPETGNTYWWNQTTNQVVVVVVVVGGGLCGGGYCGG